MKVILLQDIRNFGKAYEVKEVSRGFAQNFLLPRGLAKIADPQALIWAEKERKHLSFVSLKQSQSKEELIKRLAGLKIKLKSKVNTKNRLYAAINSSLIAKELQKKGFLVAEENIILKEPIKTLGEYSVVIKIGVGAETKTVKISLIIEPAQSKLYA